MVPGAAAGGCRGRGPGEERRPVRRPLPKGGRGQGSGGDDPGRPGEGGGPAGGHEAAQELHAVWRRAAGGLRPAGPGQVPHGGQRRLGVCPPPSGPVQDRPAHRQ